MPTPQTILDAIDANAKGPASVSKGDETVSSKDIEQLIKADQYAKAQQAVSAASGFGLRFATMQPPRAG